MDIKSQDKIRVLALGDYCCTTGFATVMSNVMQELHRTGKYDIDVVAINHTGDPYDEKKYPGRVYPAMTLGGGDVYGRQKFLDLLASGVYDVVFVLQDTFIMQTIMPAIQETYSLIKKKFRVVYYYPFDCEPKAEWITECVSKVDFPITYTHYAHRLACEIDPALAERQQIIYHGTNFDDFYPIEDKKSVQAFRTQFFNGLADGKFLITNVNRNQMRKDIIRNFMVLADLKRRGYKNIVLYLHMDYNDVGGNVHVMASNFGLKIEEDFLLPHPQIFNNNRGVPIDIINQIYNASDMVLTTTLGEGWGLSITEAMATKTPVVAPDNTSLHEMLADNRGYLAKSGETPSDWFSLGGGDNERLRPLMDVTDAADKIELIMNGELPDIEKAYAWAHNYSWATICREWVKIFDTAALEARTAAQVQGVIINRQQRRAAARTDRKAHR